MTEEKEWHLHIVSDKRNNKKSRVSKPKRNIPAQTVNASEFWERVMARATPLIDAHDKVRRFSMPEVHTLFFIIKTDPFQNRLFSLEYTLIIS